jgi:hypothetical protein
MKLITFTLLLTLGCASTTNISETRYGRDEIYCWYKDVDGRWIEHGLASECPSDAPKGGPTYQE